MRPKKSIKNEEIKLENDEFIVSKTDTDGRIIYANRVFMEIAKYSEDQLLGVPQNIIRHPDMPRGVFKFLWQTIEKGEEFFGFIKNLCADGRYYWVFANITPNYDATGHLTGYLSVRRKPNQKAIDTILPIYSAMLDIEKNTSSKNASVDDSIDYLMQHLVHRKTDYQSFVLSLFNNH